MPSGTATRSSGCHGNALALWRDRAFLLRGVSLHAALSNCETQSADCRGADSLFHQNPPPGEWRFHPEVVHMIWVLFGREGVYLFASEELTHCSLWFPWGSTLGHRRVRVRRATCCCWWSPSGQLRHGSPCCTNSVAANHGVSPRGLTCCPNKDVGFGIPSLNAPACVWLLNCPNSF